MIKYFILLFCLCLTACRVGEEYLPQNFIDGKNIKRTLQLSNTPKNIRSDWYEIFKDDVLNTLLKQILTDNLTLKQYKERLIQSRYNFEIQSKQFLPFLDANGKYQYNKSNNAKNITENINAFKLGFDASWELDVWGKGQYISEQYLEMMKNAEYSLLNIKTVISAEAISNYINLREAQEKLRIAQKNLKLQKDILKTVADKHSAGVADDLALNQAEYTVEKTNATIPLLQMQIETYKNSLAVLLGKTPDELPISLDKYKKNIVASMFKYSVKDMYNLPLNVICNRPDIVAVEAQLKEQNAVVNEAIANLYPSISLGAVFGYVSLSGKRLFNTNNQIYGYTPAITQPIWHWKQLVNNVELQKHIKEEYLLNYNETILVALSELKNAIVSVEQIYNTATHKQRSLAKMQNIFNLTLEKYHNGLVEFTDVALAEQNLLDAQNDLIENNALILQYLTAFYKAAGGGYHIDEQK